MSIFLKRCILFFGFLILIFLSILCFFSITNKAFEEIYELDKNVTTIFIGDSHIQTSINDGLIKNSENLAYHAESYYFSYFKLKILLSANPQINEVYLGYSYHNLSSYYDDYISGLYSKSVTPKYFFILPIKEQMKCLVWNRNELHSYVKKSMKNAFITIFNEGYSFKGGYYNKSKKSASMNSINKRIQAQYYDNNRIKYFSKINLKYLQNIVTLCKAQNVKLILFNAPLHESYISQVPDLYINKYHELSANMKVIDFSNLNLSEDSYLPDGDHVTEKGSYILTITLKKYLNSN